ncbi:prolyl oligopeptidase family serine peptidase [Kineosporia sp. A_224]|uniref:S9 family peptidase n=1 Tax=Kineosporia sp. A_224 TaxID=1962180 RepID=UPI0018E92B78|nr:prolyl oligopeptidase family serine peptidase [Kineosporia sp. A_224]
MPVLPYGTWPSPVDAQMLVSGGVEPRETWAVAGVTWWSESRPAEGGRIALLRRDADSTVTEVLPAGVNARTRVHEYGGGAWWVDAGARAGTVFFTSWADQRLYRVDPPGADGVHPAPVPVTPEPLTQQGFRWTDGRLTPDGALVVCVRERHEDAAGAPLAEAVNEVVALPADGSAADDAAQVAVLAGGHDFVAAPRVSPDGGHVAWVAWDHPSMPWDATVLRLGTLDRSGPLPALTDVRTLAGAGLGEPGEQSLMEPDWTPDGRLLVVSDARGGWWNLHSVDLATGALTPLHADDHEVGGPAWVFGNAHHASTPDGSVWLAYGEDGGVTLRRVGPDGSGQDHHVSPWVGLGSLRADGDRLVAVAGFADRGTEVVEIGLSRSGTGEVSPVERGALVTAQGVRLPEGAVSHARHVSFPSRGGRTAHAWFYPPTGVVDGEPLTGLDGERPPVVVHVHGGPTGAARPVFDLETQYWTSRGFAVVDVDYGGSTGYGRAYRELLKDAWGIVDVEDCAAAVEHLAAQGLADADRTAISGGSAGGYTVLLSLATTDVFRAGASHYGVSDLAALAKETHKFESRYLDGLVGPYPERADVYEARSPLTHAKGFRAPLIVLQGLEDEVVPPAQAEAVVAALAANGVPHVYLPFPGEQHGFRIAENIVTAVESELAFYGRVFGFRPAGDVRELDIVFADKLPG